MASIWRRRPAIRRTLAFSRAAGLGREHVEHLIAHKIGPISLGAQRRRLERNVGPFLASSPIGANGRT